MMNVWEQYPFLQSSSLGLMTTIKSFQLPQPESVLSNPPVLPAHSGPGSILAQSSHQSFKPWMYPGRPSSLHIETHPLASDKWDLLKPAKITCLILTQEDNQRTATHTGKKVASRNLSAFLILNTLWMINFGRDSQELGMLTSAFTIPAQLATKTIHFQNHCFSQ